MAKKKAGGKRADSTSAKIRAVFAKLGLDAASKDVIAVLSANGVTASSALVANVKARLIDRPQAGRPASTAPGKSPVGDGLLEQTLMDAKRLVDKVGSVERAKMALDLLARLRT